MFAIVCDSKKVEKRRKEDKKVEEEETFDWSKVQAGPDTTAKDDQTDVIVKATKDDPEDPYAKDGPFYDDQCLLIHRILHDENHEYIYFVSDSGSREIGVFIVLLEALMYKQEK